jgi:3-oxoacyl-[acyl-carrier protein] reductase
MKRFEGKVTLVTGAGGPMGIAVAHRLASEGAKLVLSDISGTRLEANALTIQAYYPDSIVTTCRLNVTNEEEVAKFAAQANSVADVDILINVVGGVKGGLAVKIVDLSVERWQETSDLNLAGRDDAF